ncbi:MAG TPA: transglutaminase family protein [Steroidobacteraceae bacterium]|nr:transglutaminase family protein [Steroidobacteraceae bacterium]
MKIRFGYELIYGNAQVTPMVLLLSAAPGPAQRLLVSDVVRTDPFVPVVPYRDGFGNQCTRLEAPPGTLRISAMGLLEDPGNPEPAFWGARETPISDLPPDTLMYMLPSRYCESDLLAPEALRLFGHLQPGWSRVQAICDFVHQYVDFGYAFARPTKTALETYNEGQGVCRDMAHLAIAFCRAMSIPARYATGYLGDIGVPAVDAPMDFAGCMEVFLDGAWHIFDPRNNARRIGRLLIARGRDAADVAISTAFGPATLQLFRVWTEEVSDSHALEAQAQQANVARQAIQAA